MLSTLGSTGFKHIQQKSPFMSAHSYALAKSYIVAQLQLAIWLTSVVQA